MTDYRSYSGSSCKYSNLPASTAQEQLRPQQEVSASPSLNPTSAAALMVKLADPQDRSIGVRSRKRQIGPDGFPYFMLSLAEPSGLTSPAGSLFAECLTMGNGIAIISGDDVAKPQWVYRYRDLLCFSLFGSLVPPPRFDEHRYKNTVSQGVPAGTSVREGSPSPAYLPDVALRVVKMLMESSVGHAVQLQPRLFEVPDIDDLFRLRLDVQPHPKDQTELAALSRIVSWCLPYVAYPHNLWRPLGS